MHVQCSAVQCVHACAVPCRAVRAGWVGEWVMWFGLVSFRALWCDVVGASGLFWKKGYKVEGVWT